MRVDMKDWEDDDHLGLLAGWCRRGLTYEQVAQNMGITARTLQRWRDKSPLISTALKVNKDVADCHVENAMYKSALGFNFQEQMVTNKGDVVWVTKFERPNITAQIFYLKNRRPQSWSDRRELRHQADIKSHDIVVRWGGETLEEMTNGD